LSTFRVMELESYSITNVIHVSHARVSGILTRARLRNLFTLA